MLPQTLLDTAAVIAVYVLGAISISVLFGLHMRKRFTSPDPGTADPLPTTPGEEPVRH